MNILKKSILFGMGIFAIIAICYFYLNSYEYIDKSKLPKEILMGSYSINIDDKKEVIGDADYVFLAKINKDIDTIYRDNIIIETKNGNKEISDPYTKYSITVIRNIKGTLKKNKNITVLKQGGITKDKKSVVLYEKDNLLKVGKYYVLNSYVQPDGSLLISGPNSSTFINSLNIKDIIVSKEYKNYQMAYKNQVKRERKRYKLK